MKARRLITVLLGAMLVLTGCSSGDDAVERGTQFNFVAPGGQTDIRYEGSDRQE